MSKNREKQNQPKTIELEKEHKVYGALAKEFSGLKESSVVILPVPYDLTSTWIKGSSNGPSAIIDASMNMELYDIETKSNVAEKGIYTAPPITSLENPELMVNKIEEKAREYVKKGKMVVGLGGEHTISVGLVRAQERGELSVLFLDAHADLRDEYISGKYDHACTAARIKEMCPLVQVGIRSMSEEEKEKIDPERTFMDKDLHENNDWMDDVVKHLSNRVYVSIDLDVLNPSEMPSVGTPEPGGLFWYQLTELLAKVAKKRNVVGFDVVELCPNPYNKSPDFMASKLVYTFLSQIFRTKQGL
ncbi:agmatinase [archaeon]|nr:agmatinase [archaeon]